MKSIGAKFATVVGVLSAVFTIGMAVWLWSIFRDHSRDLTARQAEMALEFDLAIRKYVGEKVRPKMAEHLEPGRFDPETMSTTYVARSIFEEVSAKFPGTVLKFSSDNPRNPANQATAEERRILDYFNRNRGADKWTGEIELDGKPYYAHFSPTRMEPACLTCHGRPQDAPQDIVRTYGSEAGFHRPLGQVVAMDTVAVPLEPTHAVLRAETAKQAAILSGAVAALTVTVLVLFRRLVGGRLQRMSEHLKRNVAEGDVWALEPLADDTPDEVGQVARSHNDLVARLRTLHESTEQTVRARTEELSEANHRLEAHAADLEASRRQAVETMEQSRAAETRAEQARAESVGAIEEVRRFNALAMGRERRIIELKEQVNEFCGQLGRDPLYPSVRPEQAAETE